MLNRLLLDRMVDGDRPRLVLVFDPEGGSFRKDLYGEYKANRPECPMDLVPQFELVKEVAKAYGIPRVEGESYEADDVIATLATMASQQGIGTHILSGDKDLMQLITPNDGTPCIHMIDPMSMERQLRHRCRKVECWPRTSRRRSCPGGRFGRQCTGCSRNWSQDCRVTFESIRFAGEFVGQGRRGKADQTSGEPDCTQG